MSLSPLPNWRQIHERLPIIFPPGIQNRDRSTWEIAARTIFVMLYAGAVEGREQWLRPDQVSRMTDAQADKQDDLSRLNWAKESVRPGKGEIPGRWYAVNTRESIRDDTIRYALIQNAAVIERPGLPTTSPAGRYALQADFAALLDPTLDEAAFQARADLWRDKYLNAGALARIALRRKRAVADGDFVLVTFPNGEARRMTPGDSTDITKAVIEVFAPHFLAKPDVIFVSESGAKVVARDDDLARAVGLNIQSDKNLPDIILVDLGPQHPRLIFVEVVATDGPINDARKAALVKLAGDAGFAAEHLAFVTAYLDRGDPPFRRTVSSLAWGGYVWFASEPDKLIILSESAESLTGA
ncbi:MAG: BsuBI/PstI family type II restriction endonuclease [Pseudomonadota bacterium]